ncbi:MAG: glycosyltransferase family 9 protein [Candidatus Omnitrophica bacterium]|nr:glycosyltransferase family 9 protein [Candidatus Omnitrophota bacterium]MDD5591952.1 glycosyltransferase family 9 protein [Candidatus Omnitrophota bacterium]
MQIPKEKIKNILVVRNDRFGEFLLNIPAFRALKETFTHARLIMVVDPCVKEIAESFTFIDEIIEWSRQKHSLPEKLKTVNLLRKKNIDMAIMLNPTKDFNIIACLAGIPIRAGYDRKWGFLLTHKIKDKKYLGENHEVEYNLKLVSLVGAKIDDKALSITIDHNIINGLLKDYGIQDYANLVALHPWTSDPIKQWPAEYFYALAQRLVRELNLRVIVIGGEEEAGKDIYFRKDSLRDNLINIAGRTTLKQLAALLSKCKLLISGDSGPVHLACAVNTRVLAIFRNDIPGKGPRRWGPWGEGHIVVENKNLNQISVDEVLEKVRGMLAKR